MFAKFGKTYLAVKVVELAALGVFTAMNGQAALPPKVITMLHLPQSIEIVQPARADTIETIQPGQIATT